MPSFGLLGQHHQESHHFEIIDPSEFTGQGMGAARAEQACHGSLLAFSNDRANGRGQQSLGLPHVFSILRGAIKLSTCSGIWQITP
jgi:hypothetical protein